MNEYFLQMNDGKTTFKLQKEDYENFQKALKSNNETFSYIQHNEKTNLWENRYVLIANVVSATETSSEKPSIDNILLDKLSINEKRMNIYKNITSLELDIPLWESIIADTKQEIKICHSTLNLEDLSHLCAKIEKHRLLVSAFYMHKNCFFSFVQYLGENIIDEESTGNILGNLWGYNVYHCNSLFDTVYASSNMFDSNDEEYKFGLAKLTLNSKCE